MTVDYQPDADLDRVAEIAYRTTELLRENPSRLYGDLVGLWVQHPAKAAQLTMTLAAWFDPDATTGELWRRAEQAANEAALNEHMRRNYLGVDRGI